MTISLPTIMGAASGCDSESSCCKETTMPAEKQDSNDGCCMSLCFCSCCGTSVFFNNKKEKNTSTVEIPSTDNVFSYSTPLSKNITSPIWHPPKSA